MSNVCPKRHIHSSEKSWKIHILKVILISFWIAWSHHEPPNSCLTPYDLLRRWALAPSTSGGSWWNEGLLDELSLPGAWENLGDSHDGTNPVRRGPTLRGLPKLRCCLSCLLFFSRAKCVHCFSMFFEFRQMFEGQRLFNQSLKHLFHSCCGAADLIATPFINHYATMVRGTG